MVASGPGALGALGAPAGQGEGTEQPLRVLGGQDGCNALPCPQGWAQEGAAGDTGDPGSLPQHHLPLEQEGPRRPAPPRPAPPPFGGSGAQLQTRCCSSASSPRRTRRPHPRPCRPLPARTKGPRGPPTPGTPTPAWESAHGATPCAKIRLPSPHRPPVQAGGGTRASGAGGTRSEAGAPPGLAAGPGVAGSVVPGGTAPRPRHRAWHGTGGQEGGHPPRAFLGMRIPRALNSCTSAERGRGGKEDPSSDGTGSPEPWGAPGYRVPDRAYVPLGTVRNPPGSSTAPAPRGAPCPADLGVLLAPRTAAWGPPLPRLTHLPLRTATACRSAALAARHRPARGDGAQLMRGDGEATPCLAGRRSPTTQLHVHPRDPRSTPQNPLLHLDPHWHGMPTHGLLQALRHFWEVPCASVSPPSAWSLPRPHCGSGQAPHAPRSGSFPCTSETTSRWAGLCQYWATSQHLRSSPARHSPAAATAVSGETEAHGTSDTSTTDPCRGLHPWAGETRNLGMT